MGALLFLRRFLLPPVHRVRSVLVCGFLGALLVAATAPVRAEAEGSWRLTLPGVPHPGSALFSALSFIAGMSLLSLAWVRLGAFAVDRELPVSRRLRVAACAALLWAAPICLGPPLLSNDVYSYAAQGELSSRGFDPAVVGPNALGGGPFMHAADSIWWNNPAPYGPAWIQLSKHLVSAVGHDAAASIWAFRGVVVLSLIVAGFAIRDISRRTQRDPAFAIAMALANPITLVHIVGGVHNDGVMLSLMLVSLMAMRRGRFFVAFLLMLIAAAVKLPAAAGFAYLGWHSPLARRLGRRFVAASVSSAVGLFGLVGSSVAMGSSLGWLGALKGTSKVLSTFAPSTMVGMFVTDLANVVGLDVNRTFVVSLFRMLALLGAGLVALRLLMRSHELGLERTLGLTMVLAVLFGPVLWPWYCAIGFALLAVAGIERARVALCVWSIAIALFVFPTSVGTQIGLAKFQAALGLLLLGFLTALSSALQWVAGEEHLPAWARRWRRPAYAGPPMSGSSVERMSSLGMPNG